MSEKAREYSHIKNDKSLINRIPNQNDLEKFEEWKKKSREKMLRSCVLFAFIVLVISIIFIVGGLFSEAELSGKIFLLLFLAMCVLIEMKLIKGYVNSKAWEMEYCNYGKVIDKYKVRKNKNTRYYYIIVEVNEKQFKIKSRSQYLLLEIDDDVTVFSVEGKEKVNVMKY